MQPYTSSQNEKLERLSALTQYHLEHCPDYARIFEQLNLKMPPYGDLSEIPYLPTALFKTRDLLSVPRDQIVKTLHSSGTSRSIPSKVYLDRETAQLQTQALAAIVSSFLGKERLPMLIIDTEKSLTGPTFSARGAAIAGMLLFGRDPFYLLDKDLSQFQEWQKRHAAEPWFIFGFTALVWTTILPVCPPNSILIHGGGWKKLEGVSKAEFKERLQKTAGITHCHNFYGMVEQTGSIAMECEEGRLHTSDYSDILVREQGVIQSFSLLPRSYPGHSLLTEDLGLELGPCSCGRKGKTFEVFGRVRQAELRGCSDVGAA